jgi:putative membrane protein
MLPEILLRYLHFISIFAVVSTVVAEHLILKPQMTRREIKRLSSIDGVYGLASILVVGAGLTMWFGVGKPAEYYTQNWIFLTKMGLFVIVGLLSIYPSVFFARQRKGDPAELVELPNSIKWSIRAELLLLALIPLMATLMARGIGAY